MPSASTTRPISISLATASSLCSRLRPTSVRRTTSSTSVRFIGLVQTPAPLNNDAHSLSKSDITRDFFQKEVIRSKCLAAHDLAWERPLWYYLPEGLVARTAFDFCF